MPNSDAYGLTQNFFNSLLKKLARQLAGETVGGSSHDGTVEVVLSGKLRVIRVRIKPRAVAGTEQLEKSVEEAVDDALVKGMELIKTEAGKLLGRSSRPGGFDIY